MSDTIEYLQKHIRTGEMLNCCDGFRLSAQGGPRYASLPSDREGPWEEVEVGVVSHREPLLLPYMADHDSYRDTDPRDALYYNVPIEVVAEVVDKHGGPKKLGWIQRTLSTRRRHRYGWR